MAETTLYGTYIEKAGELIPYDMTLEYYLNEELLCEEYSDLKRYGITIKKIATYNDGNTLKETKTINNIFYDKKEATDFLDLLLRNSVTPMSLKDIVYEYIADRLQVL